MSSFTAALGAFHGPLDLLLHLVRRDEVDVRDISLARLCDQFLAYLADLREVGLEVAGDFLVTAATLLEAKAKALLPADLEPVAGDEPPDPRRELVRQLLEYRRFKSAAAALEERAEAQAARRPRVPPDEPADPTAPAVRQVEVWDLVAAFARLSRETRADAPQVVADDTPQHVYEAEVRRRLGEAGRLGFIDVFTPPRHRGRLLGLFLAVLELVKGRAVGLEQPEVFGPIGLVWLGDPPEAG
jgi:segregation and condensation protein A